MEYGLSCIIRKDGIFLENMIFQTENEDDFSQKIHRNMISSVYLVKMIFIFPTNMMLPFCQKAKMIFSQKKHTFDISGIIEKDDNRPRKYGSSSDRKI